MTTPLFKTYSQHNCTKQHRDHHTTVRCMFPHATRITGKGPYAVIAHCGTTTIDLYEDPAEAREAKGQIDYNGCGARCFHRHEIVTISLGATWTTG